MTRMFQSSPGPKAGRYGRQPRAHARSVSRFQSSPGPKAGRYRRPRPGSGPGHGGFNPRPARRPGATRPRAEAAPPELHVSILARPEGRALLALPAALVQLQQPVSILARPEGRALPRPRPGLPLATLDVSILARPEGRALRRLAVLARHEQVRFNPRPARRPGATTRRRSSRRGRCTGFNPRPARRPGATVGVALADVVELRVSILARPEGRALPSRSVARPFAPARLFQSSPGPKAGRYALRRAVTSAAL